MSPRRSPTWPVRAASAPSRARSTCRAHQSSGPRRRCRCARTRSAPGCCSRAPEASRAARAAVVNVQAPCGSLEGSRALDLDSQSGATAARRQAGSAAAPTYRAARSLRLGGPGRHRLRAARPGRERLIAGSLIPPRTAFPGWAMAHAAPGCQHSRPKRRQFVDQRYRTRRQRR
jgi:hypothetical protein